MDVRILEEQTVRKNIIVVTCPVRTKPTVGNCVNKKDRYKPDWPLETIEASQMDGSSFQYKGL